MNHADVRGYFSFSKLYEEAVFTAPDGSILVEVGCWFGKSVIYLAEQVIASKKDIRIFAVDTWHLSAEHKPSIENEHPGFIWHCFIGNVRTCGVQSVVIPMCLPSVEAATYFKDSSIFMAFIDADHTYESVKADIAAWLPKIKPGGILAGHDYNDYWSGVKRAVDETFSNNVTIDPIAATWRAKL